MLKIKKGDTVIVIAGKNKGTTGEVLSVLPHENRLIVDKVNVVTRHIKPTQGGKKGERIKKEAPIALSNVKLIDPATKKPTRVGFRTNDKGDKVRYAKASGKDISA